MYWNNCHAKQSMLNMIAAAIAQITLHSRTWPLAVQISTADNLPTICAVRSCSLFSAIALSYASCNTTAATRALPILMESQNGTAVWTDS
jgi:hypothetical protein